MNSGERWYEHRLCSRHSTSHTTQAAGAVEGAEYLNSRAMKWNGSHRRRWGGGRLGRIAGGFKYIFQKEHRVSVIFKSSPARGALFWFEICSTTRLQHPLFCAGRRSSTYHCETIQSDAGCRNAFPSRRGRGSVALRFDRTHQRTRAQRDGAAGAAASSSVFLNDFVCRLSVCTSCGRTETFKLSAAHAWMP